MLPRRQIGGFFLRLFVVYGLLIAAWPILRGAYSSGFRAVGNVVFRSIGSHGSVSFQPLSQIDKKVDTKVRVRNRRTGFSRSCEASTHLMGYLPTAEVIALILATPLPWSRKWRALLYGCILAHGLLALRVSVLVLYGSCGTDQAALYTPGPFWGTVLEAAFEVITVSLGFSFGAPILVWVLATFRRGDLERLRTGMTEPNA